MRQPQELNKQEEWVKILAKGLITIPKRFREDLGIKEGEVAKVRKVGARLIIEPREAREYEVYTDEELKEMLAADKLPRREAKKVKAIWSDIT